MDEDNIRCHICKLVKWAFIRVETEHRMPLFEYKAQSFSVCVDCFKNKDINWIIGEEMKQQSIELIKHHQDKIDEIQKRLGGVKE